MSECIHEYYLLNGLVRSTGSFSPDYINKGNSIYEVTRLAGKGVMFLEDHIDRFFRSLEMEAISSEICARICALLYFRLMASISSERKNRSI